MGKASLRDSLLDIAVFVPLNRSLSSRLADHLKRRVDAGFISCLGPYRSTLSGIV